MVLREDIFDFVVHRKAAGFALGENHFAIDDDVELTGLAWLYLDFLAKTRVE